MVRTVHNKWSDRTVRPQDGAILLRLKSIRGDSAMADLNLNTTEVRDLTRIERIGAHSHIRGRFDLYPYEEGAVRFRGLTF
jgi:hypothetical protein